MLLRRIRCFAGVALLCVIAIVFSLPAESSAISTNSKESVDKIYDDVVARYRLPGLAVGIVKEGEVVYARAVGDASGNRRIDADTLFKIASNSKAMTAAVLARLVDAGKLKWDDPVIKYLPDFRMYDPWVTRELQVRDLLIHNSGLGAGAGDLMLWPEPNLFTRKDVIHGLRFLKPAYSFRSRYAYDNSLYIVAGEVAAAVSGMPYEALVRKELFEPLGMMRCQVGEWKRDVVGNVAQPHVRKEGRYLLGRVDDEVIPNIPMAPAGGIRCSLNDMLKWISMWLTPDKSGLIDGKPWLSAEQRKAVWSSQMIMTLTQRMRDWDDSHYSAYGYGWRLADVDGTQKVSHTGTLSGMYSAVTLLPEKNVGFVILINGDADDARTVLNQVLVKYFTAPEQKRTVAYYADLLEAEARVSEKDEKKAEVRERRPASAAEIRSNLGVYRDPWLGEVDICPVGKSVVFSARKSPRIRGEVMRAGQRWLVEWESDGPDVGAWLDFSSPADGSGTALKMSKVDPEGDFSNDFEDLAFERIGACPGLH